jgi:hypothetical protein
VPPLTQTTAPASAFVGARTIEEVLDRLDAEIDDAVRSGSRNAFFTCLYRSVTRRVLDGIRSGRFEDGPRMERLDVVFANRYLEALHAYQRNERTTESWQVTFDAARRGRLAILQHLLLGMNAHINLDLGIAAAQVAPGASLPALRRDFDEINRLLSEMLDDVQDRLARVSPWMGLLDRVGARSDEAICSFCIAGARDLAWKWAERFVVVSATELNAEMDLLDEAVTLLSVPIRRPTLLVATALAVVRMRERSDIAEVVKALR